MDPAVKFLSRGPGYTLFLSPTEAALALITSPAGANPPKGTLLRMKLVGADPQPPISGLEELQGKANYFLGNDPAQWRTNIPTYAKVKYASVYPGVDLVYYGNQRMLEYDFIVARGRPEAITLDFEGPENLEVDARAIFFCAQRRRRSPTQAGRLPGSGRRAQANRRELHPEDPEPGRLPGGGL
jgi:hypothetical protein